MHRFNEWYSRVSGVSERSILCQQSERVVVARVSSAVLPPCRCVSYTFVLLVFLNEAFCQLVILSDGSLGSWVDEKRGKTR